LDRICVSLATGDLLILLQKATPEGADNVQKMFGYLQLLNLQRALTKFVHKIICCNSVFTSKPRSHGRSFSDNESKLEVFIRKIALGRQLIPDVQFNTIKENIGLLKLLDQSEMHFMVYRRNLLKTLSKRDLVIKVKGMKNYVKALSGIQ
jgi:hypothetical protein